MEEIQVSDIEPYGNRSVFFAPAPIDLDFAHRFHF